MHMMYFTEQPMGAYDAKEGLKYGATALTFSNSNYDSTAASKLYNEYLEEYIMADEWGVDGIMRWKRAPATRRSCMRKPAPTCSARSSPP